MDQDRSVAVGESPEVAAEKVQVRRGAETYSAPLSAVTTDFSENVRLQRGDQVNLVHAPRRFSTFGALGTVSRTDMPAGITTLAGALSGAGGLNDSFANARSVLVFRFERPEIAEALGVTQPATPRGVPVVYRLNLEEASGFFTANAFIVQPEDIIYAPRAMSAELRKFCRLDSESDKLLEQAMEQLNLSARAHSRILKVARTLADMGGRETLSSDDVMEAIQYRSLDRRLWA
jgi:polysaccharide export outer membrane protein